MVLSLALWHEFMHGFVTYLAGKSWSRTPPHIIPKYLMPDENDLKEGTPLGESGDYMECLVWGGSFQMDFPYNDAAIQKCREPFAVDRNNVEKLIDMATVTDFLKSPMTFELKKAVQGKPARPRSPTPEPQPAKKKKMAGSFLGEPRPKVVRAWDIHFGLDSNALPIVIKKEATTVES
ncbi:hypothetical protein F5883DRAFT_656459 [Diaporthe sp. PMI_573]|nr:hypothetical protein F5883DRAFT_656459 [Diaporthaceae sp. PMI_573]